MENTFSMTSKNVTRKLEGIFKKKKKHTENYEDRKQHCYLNFEEKNSINADVSTDGKGVLEKWLIH